MTLRVGAEAMRARRCQDVRHSLLIQVLPRGGVGPVAQGADHGEDLVLLHQLARHLYRHRRVVLVVHYPIDDLAAADTLSASLI
jgi:hypothetical protein